MDINREEILKTAARYVVLSIGFWKPEGEFGFRVGLTDTHGEDCITDNEVLTMQFSWRGLAENVACLTMGDVAEIEKLLKGNPECLLETITAELMSREGVVCSRKNRNKVRKTRAGTVLEAYFENRVGRIQRKGGLHKFLVIEAVAQEISNQYEGFCKDSGLDNADCWVVDRFDVDAEYTGKILTWHEMAEDTIHNRHFALETNEVLFLIRENIADLRCALFQNLEFSEATIAYKQGVLRISPKANVCGIKPSQINDYLMDGMK